MTFLNPAILVGAALAALPVILHLLLKRKPKKLIFPALRLVQQRQQQNLKRIQLRHVWLLLLRVLAILLIVLALARPSLPAADYNFRWWEWLTFAAVVLVGVGVYFGLLRSWERQQLPRHIFNLRRAAARGWTTGATLLGLLLLVGCPYQQRIAAEIKSPPPAAQLDLPVAAVMLFDTSLSQTYRQEGRTRLESAVQIATDHLGELPPGSKVAIVDAASDHPILFQQTLSAAQTRLRDLKPQAVSLPLNDRLRSCLLFQEEERRRTLAEQGQVADDLRKDRFLRRVYLFTDLARTAWREGGSTLLQKELERLQTVNLFIVDVGELESQNVAVRQVRLSRQQAPVGGQLSISALIESTGIPPRDVALELNRVLPDGTTRQLGSASAQLEAGTPQWVMFPLLKDLTGPILHGEVRLASSDPLAMDDIRCFTVQVGDPPRVLVTAPRAADAAQWMAALNPIGVKFRVEFVPTSRLQERTLTEYDVLYLVNVPQLSDALWLRLSQYVEQGGGLGVFLGSDDIRPSAYERAAAQTLLPAAPRAVRERRSRHMVIEHSEHPVFRKLAEYGGVPILEGDLFVDRYFVVEPMAGAATLATLTDEDQSPLLVERSVGRGRSILFASAVDLAQGSFSRWNNLMDPSQVGWPRLALAESLTLYLSRSTDNVFNVTAGEDVRLRVEPADSVRTFLLKRPEFKQTRLNLPAGDGTINITDARDVGQYDLVELERTSGPALGFSVNPSPAESDLARMTPTDLDALLGEGRYQVARTIGELTDSVTMADLGREVYGLVLLLVLAAFLGEHLVANRFYDVDETSSPSAGRPTTVTPPGAIRPADRVDERLSESRRPSREPAASGPQARVPGPS